MHVHVCKKDDIFRQRRLNHSGVGGGVYGKDALSKLSHTATVCVAGFFIDPNPNRLVGGGTWCPETMCPETICPETMCPKTIRPGDNVPRRHYAPETICPGDKMPWR